MKTDQIKLKEEYKKLVPRPSSEDYAKLIDDIRVKGIEDPIILNQKNIIVDGYTRYDIALTLDIDDIPVSVKTFATEKEEKEYCIRKALLRRHLTIAQKAVLGLALLEIEEKKAKKRQEATRLVGKGVQKKDTMVEETVLSPKGKAADIVGEEVGVSGRTMNKAKEIMKVIEEYDDKEVGKAWGKALIGEESIESVYQKTKVLESGLDSTPPPKPLKTVKVEYKTGQKDYEIKCPGCRKTVKLEIWLKTK